MKKEQIPYKKRAIPMFSSMSHCSEGTGIPMAVLKAARREGCTAFSFGRIDLAEFTRWWFAKDQENAIDWTKRNKRAEALTRELKLQNERDQVVDVPLTTRFVQNLVGNIFFGELDRLAHECPSTLKAKTEVQIFEECEKQITAIKRALRDSLDSWVSGEAREER